MVAPISAAEVRISTNLPNDKGYLGRGTLCTAGRTKDDRSDRVYS
jgi:hypothetical protein